MTRYSGLGAGAGAGRLGWPEPVLQSESTLPLGSKYMNNTLGPNVYEYDLPSHIGIPRVIEFLSYAAWRSWQAM